MTKRKAAMKEEYDVEISNDGEAWRVWDGFKSRRAAGALARRGLRDDERTGRSGQYRYRIVHVTREVVEVVK